MSKSPAPPVPRGRSRNFAETHQKMIDAAVRLVARRGLDALSVASLAREVGINRTTMYYHFDSRDTLVAAVKRWLGEQLSNWGEPDKPRQDRIEDKTRFVLDHPEILGIWIEDFVSPGDIRDRYPDWDALVESLKEHMREHFPKADVDAEVYATCLLTAALIGPRVFKNSVRPDESDARIVERFRHEQQRMLGQNGLHQPAG
jgi:AcrR family transcriptional regulator